MIVSFAVGGALSLGQDTALTCNVLLGDLPLTISWTLDGASVDGLSGVRVISAGPRMSILTLQAVGADHSGMYMCTAGNEVGEATHSAQLTVKG